mgnify:FL=1
MKSLIVVRRTTIVLVSILFLLGCALNSRAGESEKMLILGSALTKLSATVESTVRYKSPPEDISDAELLTLSTKHDPPLLAPFEDYTMRVLQQDKHAIVLVCTKDGQRALLEDAGCTAELDKHLWKERPAKPCEFTLSIHAVCGAN